MPSTNICEGCLFDRNNDCMHPEGPDFSPAYNACWNRYNLLEIAKYVAQAEEIRLRSTGNGNTSPNIR